MRTPKSAIQEHCRECVGGYMTQVKDCQGDTVQCPLFPVRLRNGKVAVKFVRPYCLYCMNGYRELAVECSTYDCTLHPYRMGKNPSHRNRPGGTAAMFQKGEVIKENSAEFES